jgi:cell division protein FtsW (lipid II flippase)
MMYASAPCGTMPTSGKRFWLYEIWDESRDIFKALVRDTLVFVFVVAVLAGGHYLLELLGLTDERRAFLDRWHFRITTTVWLLLSCFLLLEIVMAITSNIWKRFWHARE